MHLRMKNRCVQHSEQTEMIKARACPGPRSPLLCSTLSGAGSVLVGVNKAWDEVGGDGDDEGVGNDRQDADALQDTVPDSLMQ